MKIKTSQFNPLDYLDNDAAIQDFLNSAIETNDSEYIIKVLGLAMRARGILKVSRETGLNRSALYHSFYNKNSNPGILTIFKVAHNLGYKIVLVPLNNC